jgi:hypothetical protein
VGASDDVDRVDLDDADPVDDFAEVAHVDAAGRARLGEALGGERDSTRLLDGVTGHGGAKLASQVVT